MKPQPPVAEVAGTQTLCLHGDLFDLFVVEPAIDRQAWLGAWVAKDSRHCIDTVCLFLGKCGEQ